MFNQILFILCFTPCCKAPWVLTNTYPVSTVTLLYKMIFFCLKRPQCLACSLSHSYGFLVTADYVTVHAHTSALNKAVPQAKSLIFFCLAEFSHDWILKKCIKISFWHLAIHTCTHWMCLAVHVYHAKLFLFIKKIS